MKETKYNSKKRTHEKIKRAFAQLLGEKKALNKITVAELAERSEVTRGTFYAHYNNTLPQNFTAVCQNRCCRMDEHE